MDRCAIEFEKREEGGLVLAVQHIKRTMITGVLLMIALLGWSVGIDNASADGHSDFLYHC